MKIRRLRTMVPGPALLLLPMMCVHLGDGHHTGYHDSGLSQQSHRSSTQSEGIPGMTGQGWMTIHQDTPDEK